jgi:hypothetical protein
MKQTTPPGIYDRALELRLLGTVDFLQRAV